jgi:hypothetical protein
VSFSVALDQDLDIDSAAVGDPVKLQLTGDLRHKGEVLARKGAAASGRITRLERIASATILGVTLVTLNDAPGTPARTYRVSAKLDEVVGLPLFAPPHDVRVQTGPAQPGEGLLVLRAGHLRLIRGILMYWGT